MTGIAVTKAVSRFGRRKTALLFNMLGLAVAGIKVMAPPASETLCAARRPPPYYARPTPRLPARPGVSTVQPSHILPPGPDDRDGASPERDNFPGFVASLSGSYTDLPSESAFLIGDRRFARIPLRGSLFGTNIDAELRARARKTFAGGVLPVKGMPYGAKATDAAPAFPMFAPGGARGMTTDRSLLLNDSNKAVIHDTPRAPTTGTPNPTRGATVVAPKAVRGGPGAKKPAGSSLATSASIETLLPVAPDFHPVAKIIQTAFEDVSRTDDNRLCQRSIVYVTLPCDLAGEAVDANLKAVARELYEDGMTCVMVVAFRESKCLDPGEDPVASLTFAPHGDFGRKDRLYSIGYYQVSIRRPKSIEPPATSHAEELKTSQPDADGGDTPAESEEGTITAV